MYDTSSRPRRHVHLYFSSWTNESRAWRAGRLALERGCADVVDYVGYTSSDLEPIELLAQAETIHRVGPAPSAPGTNRLKRVTALPKWWRAATREVIKAPVDLLVAHSLASLPLGVHLKRKLGAHLLYDAHELESEREGWTWPVRAVARGVESALIGSCNHTITVNDTICEWYRRAYPGLSVSTVRNVPLSRGRRGASNLRADIGVDENVLIVIYVGAFTPGRGIETALSAFQRLGDDKHLVCIGYGALADQISAAAETHSNIHLRPAVPQEQLITYLSGADVGLFQANGTSLSYRYSLPNKVFEYAAAGLAVIVGQGPELRAFVTESGLGWSIPEDVTSLLAALAPLTRAAVKARVAAITYVPPCWTDEQERLLYAYRKATGKRDSRD